MALKITSQIGTDRGITSEAYVRIADYQVSKYGSANFRIELYQSQDDVVFPGTYPGPNMSGTGPARNQQIGESLYVAMTKQVTETVTVRRMVPVQVEEEVPGTPDADGNPTTVTTTRTEMQEQDVEETITKTVPDMSGAEDVDIFAFGYGKLKAKLQDLFGEANVVDC
jgi:hypothetical protein